MADWSGFLWLFILLVANAFFVAAEFAVISARRSQIEPLAEKGKQSAKTALWAMEHATLMLATSQLGITVCSLLILNVSEPALHHLLEVPLKITGWPEEIVAALAFSIVLFFVSFLHVVLGEMVPKNLSFSLPERSVLLLAPPLVWIAQIFRFVTVSLNVTANAVLRVCGVTPKNEAASAFTLDEVSTIVAHSKREGLLSDTSGALDAAFEFTEKKVADIAIPLNNLVSFGPAATPADLERAVANHGFSRYVMCDEHNNPEGYLHLKDVIDLDDDECDDPVPAKRIRQLSSLYDQTELEDALAMMRRTGAHLAKVFTQEGRSAGVIFLEDIIEELVGEVHDATRRAS